MTNRDKFLREWPVLGLGGPTLEEVRGELAALKLDEQLAGMRLGVVVSSRDALLTSWRW
jgi:hypothetical protein